MSLVVLHLLVDEKINEGLYCRYCCVIMCQGSLKDERGQRMMWFTKIPNKLLK